MDFQTFVLLSLVFILIPGPNVLIIVSTSLSHGITRGLQTVAGTGSAMIIQLAIAGLGTASLVGLLEQSFLWIKWAGVAYLVYLGFYHLLSLKNQETPSESASGSFSKGFLISLTNPKTIVFFAAFLPQFTTSTSAYNSQILLLSILFWLLAMICDGLYAILAHWCRGLLKHRRGSRYAQSLIGSLYLGAAALLGASRNGQ